MLWITMWKWILLNIINQLLINYHLKFNGFLKNFFIDSDLDTFKVGQQSISKILKWLIIKVIRKKQSFFIMAAFYSPQGRRNSYKTTYVPYRAHKIQWKVSTFHWIVVLLLVNHQALVHVQGLSVTMLPQELQECL